MRNLITIIIFIVLISILSGVIGFQAGRSVEDQNSCEDFETFTDSGLGISFEYPCDFRARTVTDLSTEFVFDEEQELFGPVAEQYDIVLESESAVLTFSKVLEQVQDQPRSLNPDQEEFEVLEDAIVRYRDFGSDSYSYGTYRNCDDVPRAILGSNLFSDTCVENYVDNLGTQFPTLITAEITDPMQVEVVDEIVLDTIAISR